MEAHSSTSFTASMLSTLLLHGSIGGNTKLQRQRLQVPCDKKQVGEMNRNLNGAHGDSLVDAKAQTDMLNHKFFLAFID